jgi:hypothetical protein
MLPVKRSTAFMQQRCAGIRPGCTQHAGAIATQKEGDLEIPGGAQGTTLVAVGPHHRESQWERREF